MTWVIMIIMTWQYGGYQHTVTRSVPAVVCEQVKAEITKPDSERTRVYCVAEPKP